MSEYPEQGFLDSTTLGEAREWLRIQIKDRGAKCPCCSQLAKIYRRKINSGMARALIRMYRAHGCDWQNKTITLKGADAAARDESLLRFWGLIQEDHRRREDGGRAGWWRVTEEGEAFVRARTRVPKYALIYDSRLLRLDEHIPGVSIRDCLGDRFDLDELMAEGGGD